MSLPSPRHGAGAFASQHRVDSVRLVPGPAELIHANSNRNVRELEGPHMHLMRVATVQAGPGSDGGVLLDRLKTKRKRPSAGLTPMATEAW